jgi:Mitochondrial carrier protein
VLMLSICVVRMQTYYPEGSPYLSTRHAFATVWREGAQPPSILGGLRSLYRGTSATTIRGMILSTSQICSYDQIKQTFKKKGLMQEGFNLHFTCSMIAGYGSAFRHVILQIDVLEPFSLFCSITSNPVGELICSVALVSLMFDGVVDVVKVRIMNDKERQYRGVVDCVKTIMVKEGPLAFWKGFSMCWARVGIFRLSAMY